MLPLHEGPGDLGRRRPMAIPFAPLALAGYAALTVVFFWSGWSDVTARWIGVKGDPVLVTWCQQWMSFALAHGRLPFYSDYMNYPKGINLFWNNGIPLAGILLAPLTGREGPILTFNLVMTASFALSAWTSFLAIRRLVGSVPAAILGGLVYAFGPYMVSQGYNHLNLVVAFIPPLLLMVLHEAVAGKASAGWLGIALGVLGAAQLELSEEMAASAALVGVIGLTLLAATNPRQVSARAPRVLLTLGIGAIVFVVLAAWPLHYQFFGPQRIRHAIMPPGVFVSDFLNFFFPTAAQLVQWPAIHAGAYTGSGLPYGIGFDPEWDAFLGIPLLLLLLAVAVVGRRSGLVRWAIPLALVVAVLSLGPHLHVGGVDTGIRLPWTVVDRIPLLANLLPARLALYVDLLAGLLVAWFVTAWYRSRSRLLVAVGAVATVVALLPLVPRVPFPSASIATPRFFAAGGQVDRLVPGAPVLVVPLAFDTLHNEAMVWQMASGMRFKMPEGEFIAPVPPGGYGIIGPLPTQLTSDLQLIENGRPLQHSLTPGSRSRLLSLLQGTRARSVVLGPMPHEAAMLRYLTWLLGRAPEAVEGVYVWWSAAPSPPGA